ncbi:MAG: ABC transporter permease [Gemmatimonadetes bacterium]|nr:MAG: ABC transporter permease [Gemmatimonadota bacterium]
MRRGGTICGLFPCVYCPWLPKILHMANRAELTLDPLRLVARSSLRSLDHVGRFSFLVVDLLRGLAEWRIWVSRTLEQAVAVGYGSLFIVLLVAGFAGAVTSLQTGYQFTGTLPLYYAGAVISESMILELGPVLTALILAGRIGARYAAELGTMRVTEQIDALESLGRSPVSHLLLPRVLAGLLVVPALTMFANATGIVVGYMVAKGSLGLTYGDFEYGARYFFRPLDLWYSLVKSYCFAAAVTLIPCYIGFNTQQGAEGVGRATTTAVVSASVAILLLDALTTRLLLVAK